MDLVRFRACVLYIGLLFVSSFAVYVGPRVEALMVQGSLLPALRLLLSIN